MISVLIVNWNTKDLLRACLASLQRFQPSQPLEVIVVDNASSDSSSEMVAGEFPWVILSSQSENLGYAKGNNEAFNIATGEFLLTLNPDTEIYEDTLDNAVRCLQNRSDCGCIGAKQIGTDGVALRSVRGFPSVLGIIGDLLHIRTGKFDSYRLSKFDYDVGQTAPQPMGTFLMFRRDALGSIGDVNRPFDESFPIFFNEVDLLFRLDQKGWKTYYCPDVRVLHHGGEGTKQVRKNMIWESHLSLLRFFRKHHGTGIAGIGLILLAPVIYLAALVRAKGFYEGFRA